VSVAPDVINNLTPNYEFQRKLIKLIGSSAWRGLQRAGTKSRNTFVSMSGRLQTDSHYVIFTTRNDVGAECRHDARPSVQLPSVSGVDPPPLVSKDVRQICGNLLRLLTSGDHDL